MIKPRPLFTFGKENYDIKTVNEGIAITGTIQLQAYGLGGNEKDMGFEVSRYMKNKSGAVRTCDWEVKNITQDVVLDSGSNNLADGGVTSATAFYSLEKIAPNDYVRLTISNQGIGTSAGATTFAQMSFKVKSIFLRKDD